MALLARNKSRDTLEEEIMKNQASLTYKIFMYIAEYKAELFQFEEEDPDAEYIEDAVVVPHKDSGGGIPWTPHNTWVLHELSVTLKDVPPSGWLCRMISNSTHRVLTWIENVSTKLEPPLNDNETETAKQIISEMESGRLIAYHDTKSWILSQKKACIIQALYLTEKWDELYTSIKRLQEESNILPIR